MKYLLDVSTLLALLWTNHAGHDRARAWQTGKTLAVCPITELGFLRISEGTQSVSQKEARQVLLSWTQRARPKFVPCDVSALTGEPAARAKDTTDIYLASLAQRHGMKLATLDAGIKHPAAFLLPP